jgi:hypothetical protein
MGAFRSHELEYPKSVIPQAFQQILNFSAEHQADFNFTKLADGSQTVTVFPPGDLTNPHISAKLTPTIDPVPIEVNTALTGLTFIQPSIPASPTNPVEVGTTTWKQVLLNSRPVVSIASLFSYSSSPNRDLDRNSHFRSSAGRQDWERDWVSGYTTTTPNRWKMEWTSDFPRS